MLFCCCFDIGTKSKVLQSYFPKHCFFQLSLCSKLHYADRREDVLQKVLQISGIAWSILLLIIGWIWKTRFKTFDTSKALLRTKNLFDFWKWIDKNCHLKLHMNRWFLITMQLNISEIINITSCNFYSFIEKEKPAL